MQTHAHFPAQCQAVIDNAQAIAQLSPLMPRSKKLFTQEAPAAPETKKPTNIALEPTFKNAALEWLASKNSNLSEFVAQTLEVHMVAEGVWKPRPPNPWQTPIPELLKKKH